MNFNTIFNLALIVLLLFDLGKCVRVSHLAHFAAGENCSPFEGPNFHPITQLPMLPFSPRPRVSGRSQCRPSCFNECNLIFLVLCSSRHSEWTTTDTEEEEKETRP